MLGECSGQWPIPAAMLSPGKATLSRKHTEASSCGLCRWVQAFTGFMPPFKSWMPPKMMAKAAAWSDSLLGGDISASSKEQLSTLKYSFPDALPKVREVSCIIAIIAMTAWTTCA